MTAETPESVKPLNPYKGPTDEEALKQFGINMDRVRELEEQMGLDVDPEAELLN